MTSAVDKSCVPIVSNPSVKVRLLSVKSFCRTVPLAFTSVRLFKSVTLEGTTIPALEPEIVMDEAPVALSWVGVPAMALFSVKVCAPTAKPVTPSDASKLSVPCTSMLPPMLTPPVRLAVRSYKSAM